MLNIVIFSFNRSAQLSACIRSFLLYFKDLTQFKMSVIYRASTKDFEKGYQKVFSSLPTTRPDWDCFSFVQETDFKRNTLGAIDSNRDLTMFLVDDIIFKAPFSLNDKEIQLVKNNKEIVATSLRLYKEITHCYATNSLSKIPLYVKGCVWDWAKAEGDHSYCLSLDANVYKTNFILSLLNKLNFFNPNQLEAAMMNNLTNVPHYMACYVEQARVINVPANRVQKEFKNRVGDLITPEELNKKFLEEGALIDIKGTLEQVKENNTVHVEIPYVFDYT